MNKLLTVDSHVLQLLLHVVDWTVIRATIFGVDAPHKTIDRLPQVAANGQILDKLKFSSKVQ